MSLWQKLKSRKLWVAAAGIVTSAVADQPVLSAVLGGVYVLIEGVIDAVRASNAPAGR